MKIIYTQSISITNTKYESKILFKNKYVREV